MNDKIKAGLVILAGFAGIYGLVKTSKPMDPNQPIGINTIQQRANFFNEGIEKIANDLDFDKDGMNDWYVKCNDGTTYHTRSSNLIQGYDNSQQRTWYRKPKP